MVLSLTGALWTQPSLAVAALPSLRRIVSRHLALLGLPVVLLWYNIRWSADKLAMAGGTPCKSSSNTIGVSQRGDGIGTQPFCQWCPRLCFFQLWPRYQGSRVQPQANLRFSYSQTA